MNGAFLRFERPELVDDHLFIRAIDAGIREHRRHDHASPLAYLYARADADEPQTDLRLAAGHYDQTDLVWVFSGEVPGIIGLTEPLSPATETPGR